MGNQYSETYRDQIHAMLDERPSMRYEKHDIAERLGCSVKTVERAIHTWLKSGRDWVYERAVASQTCEKCEMFDVCRELDAVELPVMCESVPERDVELAAVRGMLDVLDEVRAEGFGAQA